MTIHSAPRSSSPKQEALILEDASLKACSQVASAIAILVGCLVLVGWIYNSNFQAGLSYCITESCYA